MPENYETEPRYYPYTLDFGVANHWLCEYTGCPSKKYPGMWEIHLTDIMNEDKTLRFVMDPDVTDYDATLTALKKNFEANYKLNRAPFGFHTHYHWFYYPNLTINPDKIRLLREFYEYVSTFPNVLFAT